MLTFPTLMVKSEKTVDDNTMYDLLFKSFVIPEKFEYQVILVTEDYAYRPDLIAKAIYGNASYMDIICKLNGVCNIMDIGVGTRLIVPNQSYLDMFYNKDTGTNTNVSVGDSDSSSDTSTQKTSTESRKANEQVTGDSNFRINKDNKIVIY